MKKTLIVTILASVQIVQAQYVFQSLHPSGHHSSMATGIRGSQIVGLDWADNQSLSQAVILRPGQQPITLTPRGFTTSEVHATDGDVQIGFAGLSPWNEPNHAMLWRGSAESAVDLNPGPNTSSEAYGGNRNVQVGNVYGGVGVHATLWRGSAGSAVDLHPTNSPYEYSNCGAGDENTQVGVVFKEDSSLPAHAVLWHGSAQSMVDLHPAGYFTSNATAMYGDQQGGEATHLFNIQHAILWHGTAESAIDLNPSVSDYSTVTGMSAGAQVGYLYSTIDGHPHAALWHGSAASYVDLNDFLPSNYLGAFALGIDQDSGVVVGWAQTGLTRGEAVSWTPVAEPPTWLGLIVGAALVCPRRSCRCRMAVLANSWSRERK